MQHLNIIFRFKHFKYYQFFPGKNNFKTFVCFMSDKELIARIHKELKNLNANRTNYQPATQLINGKLTDNSLKKVKINSKYMKKCSISLTIKKMQIKQHRDSILP
jgi:hypothetical protein